MDLLAGYTNPFESQYFSGGKLNSFEKQSIQILKIREYFERKFANANICFLQEQEYSGKLNKINDYSNLSFSLMYDSDYYGYDVYFNCSFDTQNRFIKVTSKVLKDGVILNAKRQNIKNSINRYIIYQNAKTNLCSIRMNPLDGQIRFQYVSHFSQDTINYLLNHPQEIYELFETQIRNLSKNWNKILYRILYSINQFPKDALNPQNKKKIDQNISNHILQIRNQIEEIEIEINQSHIEYPFMIESDPNPQSRINFKSLHHNQAKKRIQRYRNIQKKFGKIQINEETQNIISFMGGQKETPFFCVTNNLEKTDRNRNVLVVNNIHKDHKIYSPVTIYEILRDEIITTGGFAVIRRFVVRGIKHSDSDEIKTLVMVNKTAEDQRLFWQKKLITAMGDFHCPFIQKYYKPTYVSENPDYKIDQNILMDFCPFHSLNQFLASQNSVLSLPIKIYFLYQISVGLRFLRDLGIVHLDIKPQNILMNQCFSGMVNGRANIIYILRLIDFGQSYWKASQARNTKRGLTVPFASPQQIKRQASFTEKTDVFSLGVMILTMIFQLNITELKRLGPSFFVENGDQYLKLFNICSEKCKYLGFQPLMIALLNLAFKCLKNKASSRPLLDWLCIILKKLTNVTDYAFR